MKTLFTLMFSCFLLFPSHAQIDTISRNLNPLLQFLSNELGMKNLILNNLIAKRCTRYLPAADHSKCQDSVSEMIKVLDSDILFPSTNPELFPSYAPQAFLFVAFKKNLIDLLSAPTTTVYMTDLQAELNEYLLGNNADLNLWDFSLKYFKTPSATARALSALFQDTSLARLHLNFLEKARIRGRQNFTQNKELLEKLLETLNMIMVSRADDLQILLYPKSVKPTLNRNMYHFYVPFYLSQVLKEKNHGHFAYVAPMLMTLTYEFITSANDYRYIYDDPATLPAHEWKIRDIYAGHQGASMGAGRLTVKEFKSLQNSFKISVKDTVKAMLAR